MNLKARACILGLLVIFCASVGVILFNDGNFLVTGVFMWILGLWPLTAFCYCISVLLGFENGKSDLLTEDDLEDEVLYGEVKTQVGLKGLTLLKNLNTQEINLYRLTYVPANIFRGKDAKNFSRMKKATE